ncbi:PEP-CTERM sorting domain-containing protein [Cerasicoccus frondis]|uniref:PEP-CTERM sorting domain-containing protein n=1 Tax=Cerasicoccus frondis TaxID=490090 RepID=UPI002852DA93|nr:PEP-CTERM sorting domain-containing protein [Cerasicoccus frondis]
MKHTSLMMHPDCLNACRCGTLSAIGLITLSLSVGSLSAADISVNFENGAADYDNGSPQTTGDFRDVSGGTNINLSSNASGNNYLIFSNGTAATVYDSSPSSTDSADSFAILGGQSATFVTEWESTTMDNNGSLTFGLWNSASTGVDVQPGIGIGIFLGSGNDIIRYQTAQNLQFNFFTNTTVGGGAINTDSDTFLRMELMFANNADNTGASLSTNVYEIDAFGGTVVRTIGENLTHSITFGTGSGEVDMDPANVGVSLFFTGGPSSGTTLYLDNIGFSTIPEPASAILLGSVGLLAGLVYSRRRNLSRH